MLAHKLDFCTELLMIVGRSVQHVGQSHEKLYLTKAHNSRSFLKNLVETALRIQV